ncbi:hypothetical protein SMI01S_19980 [Sphingobacterium mizutaii NBRC 14946 = DSM 11724]|uniref:Uncharacterized protein n=2 Tax=Sphingobacterium mizutaii TaxID=1010 RepID=A0AAJ4XCW4_9SPHI|nr:hypothetical protein [Sphingobacterium mizutaii]GEM68392.1 hypothetical protein SMI01S_19980 [Sphingobacterium mizutaii NBRC 14946 = DSM 11724]SDL06994.1 hypothetical protein SAMN05192578_1011127 [Sphingobacterium mizutaii]SNV51012.1 Uncharacterised protein [Sphingobacterium mizutaii]
MFWKNNSKNIKELEYKLLNSDAELSFLNAQTERELSKLYYNQSSDDGILKSKYQEYQQEVLAISKSSVHSVDEECKLLSKFIDLYAGLSGSEHYHMVDLAIEDADGKIPALLLFPIVQNAMVNGYNSMSSFPLKIKLKVKGQQLSLEVSNRVNHYLSNQADDPRIKQLESRLFLEYAEDYNLFINSNSNLFKITLLIKLKRD